MLNSDQKNIGMRLKKIGKTQKKFCKKGFMVASLWGVGVLLANKCSIGNLSSYACSINDRKSRKVEFYLEQKLGEIIEKVDGFHERSRLMQPIIKGNVAIRDLKKATEEIGSKFELIIKLSQNLYSAFDNVRKATNDIINPVNSRNIMENIEQQCHEVFSLNEELQKRLCLSKDLCNKASGEFEKFKALRTHIKDFKSKYLIKALTLHGYLIDVKQAVLENAKQAFYDANLQAIVVNFIVGAIKVALEESHVLNCCANLSVGKGDYNNTILTLAKHVNMAKEFVKDMDQCFQRFISSYDKPIVNDSEKQYLKIINTARQIAQACVQSVESVAAANLGLETVIKNKPIQATEKVLKKTKLELEVKNAVEKRAAVRRLGAQIIKGEHFIVELKALARKEKDQALKANLSKAAESMEKALVDVKSVIKQVANRKIDLKEANESLQAVAKTIELVFEKVKPNQACQTFAYLSTSIKHIAYNYGQTILADKQASVV